MRRFLKLDLEQSLVRQRLVNLLLLAVAGESSRTLTLVWGTAALPGRADAVADWQQSLFERLGASVERV